MVFLFDLYRNIAHPQELKTINIHRAPPAINIINKLVLFIYSLLFEVDSNPFVPTVDDPFIKYDVVDVSCAIYIVYAVVG